MRITACASGIKVPWTGCGSRTLPTCAAPKAGSTCAPCVMRTRAESWDTPWASSTTRALVITALDMAATTRGGFPTGVVLHADRGTQFTSEKLAAYMRAVQGRVSMGRAGVCWDNAMAESFWATLTTEYYYRRTFTTRDQVYTGVATWIEDFYNRRRIHTSLGGKSTIEYERHLAAWTTAASTNCQQLAHNPRVPRGDGGPRARDPASPSPRTPGHRPWAGPWPGARFPPPSWRACAPGTRPSPRPRRSGWSPG